MILKKPARNRQRLEHFISKQIEGCLLKTCPTCDMKVEEGETVS